MTEQAVSAAPTTGHPDALQALIYQIAAWVESTGGQTEVVGDDSDTVIAGITLPAATYGPRAERISLSINYTP